jgi:hypothetical protein
MSWLVGEHDDGECHVIPILDIREHYKSIECWCKPTPEVDAPNIIVHHSADKRETREVQ